MKSLNRFAELRTRYPTAPLIQVTGDRNWSPRLPSAVGFIHGVLTAYQRLFDEPILFVHGDARGVDTIAAHAAESLGWFVTSFPADWETYGKSAGPIRNRLMLSLRPTLLLAFHNRIQNSKGTKDCVLTALKQGIPVRIYSDLRPDEVVTPRTEEDVYQGGIIHE